MLFPAYIGRGTATVSGARLAILEAYCADPITAFERAGLVLTGLPTGTRSTRISTLPTFRVRYPLLADRSIAASRTGGCSTILGTGTMMLYSTRTLTVTADHITDPFGTAFTAGTHPAIAAPLRSTLPTFAHRLALRTGLAPWCTTSVTAVRSFLSPGAATVLPVDIVLEALQVSLQLGYADSLGTH